MKKDDEMEQMLLAGASLDELIKMKMEEEFKDALEKSKEKPKKTVIKNISEVPKEKIFSKEAVYKIFNRNSRAETYINGIQAEALIGIQHGIRQKMLDGVLSAFTTEDAYVKFEEICVTL